MIFERDDIDFIFIINKVGMNFLQSFYASTFYCIFQIRYNLKIKINKIFLCKIRLHFVLFRFFFFFFMLFLQYNTIAWKKGFFWCWRNRIYLKVVLMRTVSLNALRWVIKFTTFIYKQLYEITTMTLICKMTMCRRKLIIIQN